MNVKELKALIADLPDETPIVLEGDIDGNEYADLTGARKNMVQFGGEFYFTGWSAFDAGFEEKDENIWEEAKKGEQCLILTPNIFE